MSIGKIQMLDGLILGKDKLMLLFSAERLRISAPRSPARWLHPLKPGGKWKSAYVQQKTVTLIYPDPLISTHCNFMPVWNANVKKAAKNLKNERSVTEPVRML
jgi:hypothetical protein